jgi:hypothetical protein
MTTFFDKWTSYWCGSMNCKTCKGRHWEQKGGVCEDCCACSCCGAEVFGPLICFCSIIVAFLLVNYLLFIIKKYFK